MSCMSFGEINIPSSRAFWDDCDEDDPVQTPAEKLQLAFETGQSDKPFASDLLFLIEGLHVTGFAEKVLLKETTRICAIPSKKSTLHLTKSNVLVGIIDEDLGKSGEITELLTPYAELARNVITLTLKPYVDYKSERIESVKDEVTFLRGINSQLTHIIDLEAPNFIAGVAAGVASWRENRALPVSSYVAYTDLMQFDAAAAEPILKLLQDLGIECAKHYTPARQQDTLLYS